MLRERGVIWSDTRTVYKRGAVVKARVTLKPVPQTGQTVPRREWVVDTEPPVFTENREYVTDLYENTEAKAWADRMNAEQLS